ncbi:MAG: hypothetical protein ACFFGZ_13975 [Candidatus Thorarchaeota archaeon]
MNGHADRSIANTNENLFDQLQSALKDGIIDRTKHWQTFQQAVNVARESSPSNEEINTLNRIDALFYDNWNVRKLSIAKGTLFFLLLTIISEIVYWLVLESSREKFLAIAFYMLASFVSVSCSHVVVHWLTGRIVGIRFRGYFISRTGMRTSAFPPPVIIAKPPIPGIKYELGSFLRASRGKRTLMLISAPILMSLWFILNYWLLIQYFSFQDSVIRLIGIITILAYIGNLIPSYLWGDLREARLDY